LRARRPQRLQYARTQSDVLAKEQGTFQPRPAYDKAKRKAEVKQELGRKRRAKEAAAALAPPSIAAAPPPRLAPTIAAAPAPYPLPALRPPFPGAYEEALPHKILFVQGLGEKVEPGVLQALFSQFPGFREVRTVEAKGIAFVDYDSEPLAGAALAGLQGFKLDGEPITVTYAKR
jgi:U1 small nuclear ribonucleoprotein A